MLIEQLNDAACTYIVWLDIMELGVCPYLLLFLFFFIALSYG